MKRITTLAALLLGLMLAVAVPLAGARTDVAAATPVTIQLLAVSDWHAQLDPLNGVGGASALSAYWKADRAANPNTLTLTAGDAYGASPPLSAFFDEEPAVKAMNLMGFTADTFGNHNFDKGIPHLQSMIDLADFDYLSANLKNVEDELDGVAPWKVYDVGGVKVGVVGITNPEAPTLVFPGSFGTIVPVDPVPAANKAKAAAKAAGAKVLVAIAHLGITGVDATGAPSGPLRDFAENVGGFDVILGDHTDVQYSAVINNALVIENRSRGVTYSKTTLTVDPQNGRIIERGNTFVTPTASADKVDQAIVDMLAPYRTALGLAFDQRIGGTTAVFPHSSTLVRTGEAAIGNLVADSLRLRYGTQLAIANGGGIRKPIPSDYVPLTSGFVRSGCSIATPCDVLVGDAYAVLPFGNTAVTRTVTGAQLRAVLEHSVGAMPASSGRFLQISGFRFTYDTTKSPRVQSLTLADGTPIVDPTSYTLALPDFTNAGGDGYTMLADGQGTSREFMAEVLRAHITSLGTLTPFVDGRITRLG